MLLFDYHTLLLYLYFLYFLLFFLLLALRLEHSNRVMLYKSYELLLLSLFTMETFKDSIFIMQSISVLHGIIQCKSTNNTKHHLFAKNTQSTSTFSNFKMITSVTKETIYLHTNFNIFIFQLLYYTVHNCLKQLYT